MTHTTTPIHVLEERSETMPARATIEAVVSRRLDLRIVAFMLVVAVVQLLSFKRPFS